jgi:hypothetical protein
MKNRIFPNYDGLKDFYHRYPDHFLEDYFGVKFKLYQRLILRWFYRIKPDDKRGSIRQRGTDPAWEIYKNPGDAAHHARCKCGYHYCCSSFEYVNGLKFEITYHFHPYCPNCGAYKPWVLTDIAMKEENINPEFEGIKPSFY